MKGSDCARTMPGDFARIPFSFAGSRLAYTQPVRSGRLVSTVACRVAEASPRIGGNTHHGLDAAAAPQPRSHLASVRISFQMSSPVYVAKLIRVKFDCGQTCVFHSRVAKDERVSESLARELDRALYKQSGKS